VLLARLLVRLKLRYGDELAVVMGRGLAYGGSSDVTSADTVVWVTFLCLVVEAKFGVYDIAPEMCFEVRTYNNITWTSERLRLETTRTRQISILNNARYQQEQHNDPSDMPSLRL
jgi:hypothetical protein